MCVVSMIMDQGYRDWPWNPRTYPTPYPYSHYPKQAEDSPSSVGSLIQAAADKAAAEAANAENDKLAKLLSELLRKAAEYDKLNKEPHCESADKKARLQKLADELGVKIEFPEDE